MPIDKAKRDEWRALAEKATPGPWRIYGPGTSDPTEIHAPDPDYDDPDFGVVVFGGDLCRGEIDDDAAFILAAREAVPALLDEVERLEREVGEARREYMLLKEGSSVDAQLGATLIRQRDHAHASSASALSLLREIEWHGPVGGEFKHRSVHSCPCCGKPRSLEAQHAPDCRLAALLK